MPSPIRRSSTAALATLLVLAGCRSPGGGESPAAGPSDRHSTVWVGASTPRSGSLEVKMMVPALETPTFDFVVPSWVPGDWTRRDFAKQIGDLRAKAEGGVDLPVERVGLSRFRVTTRGKSTVLLDYRLNSGSLEGGTSVVERDGLRLLPGSFLGYVEGRRQDPVELFLSPPADSGWRVATSLAKGEAPDTYRATTWDELSVSPILIGRLVEYRVEAPSGPAYLAAEGAGRATLDAEFIADCRRLLGAAETALGRALAPRYQLMVHFADHRREAAVLGHPGSSELILGTPLVDETSRREAARLAARALAASLVAGIGLPEEITRSGRETEALSPSLWVADGIARHLGDKLERAAGLIDDLELLDRLSTGIRRVEDGRLRGQPSLAERSRVAWGATATGQVSAAEMGAVWAALLDLSIIAGSEGRRGLAGALASAVGPLDAGALKKLCEAAGAPSLDRFFADCVDGSARPPYEATLAGAGLTLTAPEEALRNDIGLELERDRVVAVRPRSPAAKAGIEKEDRILEFGGEAIDGDLDRLVERFGKGSATTIAVLRRGENLVLPIAIDRKPARRYTVSAAAGVDAAVAARLAAYCTGVAPP